MAKEKPKTKITRSPSKKFTYTARDGTKHVLTEQQKLFCDAYLKCGARGVTAVYEAGYKPKNARVASAIAYENLMKPHIFNYINLMYEESGFNDEDITKEHLFLIKQDGDLPAKAKGLDMYYKLKGKFAPEKIETEIKIIKVGAWKTE